MDSGEQCVMILGVLLMHKLYADNYDTQLVVSEVMT